MVNKAAPFVAGPGEVEVERVVTASMSTLKEAIFGEMERIRARALQKNDPQEIHAVLHYQSGWFVHWAEGPKTALAELMRRLQNDPRHHSLHTLHTSRGLRLLHTPWSMAMSQSTEPAVQFGRRVMALREQLERGKQYSPPSVLRRLSAPMQLAQARSLSDPEAFHRVGICAASGNAAFDMVEWLSARHGEPVVRRRFAGERDMDGSSEYVDFMESGYPCRMIAVARTGLSHGLRRAFLPDWPYFVLLFTGAPPFDDDLMTRMLAACQGLPATPCLLGVAPDSITHQRIRHMAQTAGLDYVIGDITTPDNCAGIWEVVREQLQQAGPPPNSAWDVPRLAA